MYPHKLHKKTALPEEYGFVPDMLFSAVSGPVISA